MSSEDEYFPLSNYLYFVFALLMLMLGVSGDELNPLLRFQREQVAAGEWWRILSCSYVHLGLYHMALNQLGFLLWQLLFGYRYSGRSWLMLLISISVATGFMLQHFSTSVEFYAGFSGLLHGLMVFSALLDYRRSRVNICIVMALWIKVLYEQMPSFDPNYLQAYIHAPVIVDAHFYGVISGSAMAIITLAYLKLMHKPTAIRLGSGS